MGSDSTPGECPLCGEEADFAVTQDATVTAEFEVPDDAERIVGHYDPAHDYFSGIPAQARYYYHYRFPDTSGADDG